MARDQTGKFELAGLGELPDDLAVAASACQSSKRDLVYLACDYD
jgi:hypothetical protein